MLLKIHTSTAFTVMCINRILLHHPFWLTLYFFHYSCCWIILDQLRIIMANNFLLIIYTIQQKSFIRSFFSVSFHVSIYIYVWTILSFGWFVVVVGLLHYCVVAYDWHFHKISYFVILHFFWSVIIYEEYNNYY